MVKLCQTCRSKAELETTSAVWEGVQVDLVDIRSEPDSQLKWILHIFDHLRSKGAVCVCVISYIA